MKAEPVVAKFRRKCVNQFMAQRRMRPTVASDMNGRRPNIRYIGCPAAKPKFFAVSVGVHININGWQRSFTVRQDLCKFSDVKFSITGQTLHLDWRCVTGRRCYFLIVKLKSRTTNLTGQQRVELSFAILTTGIITSGPRCV